MARDSYPRPSGVKHRQEVLSTQTPKHRKKQDSRQMGHLLRGHELIQKHTHGPVHLADHVGPEALCWVRHEEPAGVPWHMHRSEGMLEEPGLCAAGFASDEAEGHVELPRGHVFPTNRLLQHLTAAVEDMAEGTLA